MSDDYNLFQQICIQMFAVDLVGAFAGPEFLLQATMDHLATHAMDRWLGKYGWRITWGPRVWKSPKSSFFEGPSNTWMIAMAPGVTYPDGSKFDTYVVSLAGTAYFSTIDWSQEDFGVANVIDFDAFTKTFKSGNIKEPEKTSKPNEGPYAAWGTAWGVYQLITNTSPAGRPGEGTTILQYLAGLNQNEGNFRVIFTGHSLGGALSPFLALAVQANALIPALADKPQNVLVLPAAGPTFGDGPLREAYNELFPASGPGGYQQWNSDLFNSIDIVPQSWSTDDSNNRFLDKIVDIYGNLGDNLQTLIQSLVTDAKNHAKASSITYEPIRGNEFTGVLPSQPPDGPLSFIEEAIKQHTRAYHDQVGISDVTAQLYLAACSREGIKKKTAYHAALDLPVLRGAADLLRVPPKSKPDGVEAEDPDNGTIYPYDCILAP